MGSSLFSGLLSSTRSSGAGAPAGAPVPKLQTQTNFDRLSSHVLPIALSFLDTKDRAAALASCKSLSTRKAVLSPSLAILDLRDNTPKNKFAELCQLEKEKAKFHPKDKPHTLFSRLTSAVFGINAEQFKKVSTACDRLKVLIVEDVIRAGGSVESILKNLEQRVLDDVPINMQRQVLAALQETAFHVILERFARELIYDLGCQIIQTDAMAVCAALAVIPTHTDKAANLAALKALIADQHPGAVDKARDRLVRVCTHPQTFNTFVTQKRKTLNNEFLLNFKRVKAIREIFQGYPLSFISSLNQRIECDLCRGFPVNQGKVVAVIPGLGISARCIWDEVEKIVETRIAELRERIAAFEKNNQGVLLAVNQFMSTPHTKEELLRAFIPSRFVEYQKAVLQLQHLTGGNIAFYRKKQAIDELRVELAKIEAPLLDVPRCCVADIEARRKSLDLLAPEGDRFSWPEQVTHFVPPAREESKKDAECVEQVD